VAATGVPSGLVNVESGVGYRGGIHGLREARLRVGLERHVCRAVRRHHTPLTVGGVVSCSLLAHQTAYTLMKGGHIPQMSYVFSYLGVAWALQTP
jgi:hypothetical protein